MLVAGVIILSIKKGIQVFILVTFGILAISYLLSHFADYIVEIVKNK